ncbi:MAG: hypothetical protein HN790_03280 [Methylococcales bacterium]|nr:hypothetical protein [Methylococcales bacterium]
MLKIVWCVWLCSVAVSTSLMAKEYTPQQGVGLSSFVNQISIDGRYVLTGGDPLKDFISHHEQMKQAVVTEVKASSAEEDVIKLIFFQNEMERGVEGRRKVTKSPSSGHSYVVTVRPNKPLIIENEEMLEQAEIDFINSYMKGDSTADVLGRFFYHLPLVPNSIVEPSAELSKVLGLTALTFQFSHSEERWHRRVNVWAFQAISTPSSRESGEVKGHLVFDVETGRPLSLSFTGQLNNPEPIEFQGKTLYGHQVVRRYRAWSYSDIPMAGLDVAVLPAISPEKGSQIDQLLVSPSGRNLVVAVGDVVSIWDIASRRLIKTLTGIGDMLHFAESHDSEFLVVGSNSGFAQSYMISGAAVNGFGQVKNSAIEKNDVGKVDYSVKVNAISTQGLYLIEALKSQKIKVLNLGYDRVVGDIALDFEPQVIRTIEGDRHFILSAQGQLYELTITLKIPCKENKKEGWCSDATMQDYRIKPVELPKHWLGIDDFQISADGEMVATSINNQIEVYQLTEKNWVTIPSQSVYQLCPGTCLATSEGIWRWDNELKPNLVSRAELSREASAIVMAEEVLFLAEGDQVNMVDSELNVLIDTLKAHTVPLYQLAIKGAELVAMGKFDLIKWNLSAPSVLSENISSKDDWLMARFNPSSRIFVGNGQNIELHQGKKVTKLSLLKPYKIIRIADDGGGFIVLDDIVSAQMATVYSMGGAVLSQIKMEGSIIALQWHSATMQVVTVDIFGNISHWDLDSGGLTHQVTAELVTNKPRIHFSEDGQLVLISGLKSVSGVWNKFMPLMRLYQTATLKPLVDLDATWSDITSTQVSADLGLVVSGTKTGQLLMWDINSGALVNTIKAHDNAIMDLQVQNAKLVTASLDGRVRFWDALAYAQFNVDFTSIVVKTLFQGLGLDRQPSLLATLVAVDQRHYVMTTPDGYYTASLGALDKLSFIQYRQS